MPDWQVELRVRQLAVRRGELQRQYDFTVTSGELLVLMGPSGSGKSSLLECLGGFLPADQGSIWLSEQRLDSLTPEQRPVSSLFQQYNLFEHVDVATNLRLGFTRASPTPLQWQKIEAACEQLGVAGLEQRLPAELSGGQRQRIALIRTVLREQPILLLDEPFSALDEHSRYLAGDWIGECLKQTGQLALLVTHQSQDAERWADQTLKI